MAGYAFRPRCPCGRLSYRALPLLGILLLFFLWLSPTNTAQAVNTASQEQTTSAFAQAFTGQEFVRNGTLDGGSDDWGQTTVQGSGWIEVQSGGPTGNYLRLYAFGGASIIQAYQQIFLPTRTDAVKLTFDYRVTTPNTTSPAANFFVGIISNQAIGTWVVESNVVGDTGWRSFQYTLNASELAALQNARDNNQAVFLVFELATNLEYEAYIDNISLSLDGSWTFPSFQGMLAFSSVANNRPAIEIARPDGTNRRTVWRVPDTAPNASAAALYGLQWKPGSNELAFASTHEFGTSNFKADIYLLNTWSGSVRRLTNGPGLEEVQAGGYARGSVTGQVRHNFPELTSLSTFMVYVQGAEAPVNVPLGTYGNTASFTISNVADLGSSAQYIAFIWSGRLDTNGDGIGDKDCISITRAPVGVDVQANQTTNAGTLDFNDSTACLSYEANAPTWRPDGSKVGFLLDGVPAAVDTNGNFDAQGPFRVSGVVGVGDLAWNPKDTTQLAYSVPAGSNVGLYRVNEGATNGTLLTNIIPPWELDWLPDGSAIIFTNGYDLFRYDFGSGQTTQLTNLNLNRDAKLVAIVGYPLRDLAVSPDGKYVIFSRRGPGDFLGGDTQVDYSLWILNLQNLTEMWQVIPKSNNANRYVDWALVPTVHTTFLPIIIR